MIKAETFRYLENALTSKLMKEVKEVTKPLYAKIMKVIEDGDYVLAKEMVGRLSLASIYFKMEPTLIYHTHLAMLFGASRVTEHPGTSVVGLGFEKMAVQQIVQGFMGVFSIGQTYLQEKLLQLIAEIEQGEKVKKGNPYHAEDGTFTSEGRASTYSLGDKVVVDGQSVVVTKPKGYDKLVEVDVEEFDKKFKENEDFYIGVGGVGGIKGRYKGFDLFFRGGKDTESIPNYVLDVPKASEMEASIVEVDDKGKVSFVNGRHRYAWLRDQKLDKIPVAMDEESIKNGKKFKYVKDNVKKAAKKPRILKDFQSHMDEEGKSFLNIVSSLHTSRVSAYGFTAEANVLGVKEYQISEQLDSRTCPVCAKMHGKKFPVREARSFLSIVARMTDAEGLKFMQPWPKHDKGAIANLESMTAEDLVAKHWHVPPFHPRCRGMLTAVGKVLPLDAEMPDDEKPIVDKVEFDVLGLKVNDDQVKLWKDNLNGVTPSVLLALASDKTPDVLLAHSVKEGKVHSLIDLLSMTISKKFLKFVLGDVQYTFGLEEQQMLLEGSSKFTRDVMSRAAMHYLRKMYMVGKEAGMKSLKMVVTKDPYLWAKRGFYPSSLEEWEKAKELIKGRYMSAGISQEVKDAIEVILKSDNPADMGKLVDLDIPKDLLKDLVWGGTLQFDDPASMEKFLTYLSE